MRLPTLVPAPPFYGRGKSRPDATLPMPYARVASKLERRALVGTAGGYFDWRRVTLSIWGEKADVVQALGLAGAVFNNDLGRVGKPFTLTFPSQAASPPTRFLGWLADRQPTLEQDATTFQSKDVWKGEISGLVWTWRGA